MLLVIDSNLLIGDSRFNHRVWQLVAGRPERWGLSVGVPQVVYAEVVAHCQREMQTARNKLQADVRTMLKYGLEVPGSETVSAQIDQMVDAEPERFADEFARRRIRLLEVPDLDHNVLVRRAIQRVRPFGEGGRGYRDTLIWFTLLELMDTHPSELVVFASQNFKDFAAGSGPNQHTLHEDLIDDITQRGHDSKNVKYLVSLDEVQDCLIAEHGIESTSPTLSTYSASLTEKIIRELSSEPTRELDMMECGLPLSLLNFNAMLTKASDLGPATITKLDGFEASPYQLTFQGECTLYPALDGSRSSAVPVQVVSKQLLAKGDVVIDPKSGVTGFTIDSIRGVDSDIDVVKNRETMAQLGATVNMMANAFARDVGTQLALSNLTSNLQSFANAAVLSLNSSGAARQIADSIASSPGIQAAQARIGEMLLTELRRGSADVRADRAIADVAAQVAAQNSSALDAAGETARTAADLDAEAVANIEKLAQRAQEIDLSDVHKSVESAKRILGE